MATRTEAPPTRELRTQHRTIERALGVLSLLVRRAESAGEIDTAGLRACLDFLRLYADKLHHADEEALLFPLLKRRLPASEQALLLAIEREHEEARKLTVAMRDALPMLENGVPEAIRPFAHAARQYLALIRQHINKEDYGLFAVADKILTPRDRTRLTRDAMLARAATFEGRSRDVLEAGVDALVAAWGTKREQRAAARPPRPPKVPGRKPGRPRKNPQIAV